MTDFTDLTDHEKLIRSLLVKAMTMKRRAVIFYDDEEGSREVEPHAIGWTVAGNACVRVYQVAGFSNDMNTEGWRMLELAKIKTLGWTGSSNAPRDKYRMDDKGMVRIYAQLDLQGGVIL